MKSAGRILLSFVMLLIAAVVTHATDNPVLGLVSMPVTATVVNKLAGVDLMGGQVGAFATIAALPRTPQGALNPGGGRRLFVLATDNIVGYWPQKATDITDGEITTAPVLVTGTPAPTFVEFQISDNSLKLMESLKGSTGYQSWEQGLEFKVAGYTKAQCAAIEKLINTEVLAVAVLNDGQKVLMANSFSGLQFEIVHDTGAKGGDRREWTLKAKQDGLMNGYLPIATTVTLPGVAS